MTFQAKCIDACGRKSGVKSLPKHYAVFKQANCCCAIRDEMKVEKDGQEKEEQEEEVLDEEEEEEEEEELK